MSERTLSQVIRESLDNQGASTQESVLREVLSWAGIIILAISVALLLNGAFIVNAQVTSGSMERTIMTGDRVIGLRTAFWFSEPKRGDIVFFKNPDNETEIFVKRICGVPGDLIEINDGRVYINGELYPEPFLAEEAKPLSFGPFQVPEGCYFMLGDNRNHSSDSRYWSNTYVQREKILGKAYWVYYPRFESVNP